MAWERRKSRLRGGGKQSVLHDTVFARDRLEYNTTCKKTQQTREKLTTRQQFTRYKHARYNTHTHHVY